MIKVFIQGIVRHVSKRDAQRLINSGRAVLYNGEPIDGNEIDVSKVKEIYKSGRTDMKLDFRNDEF